MADDEMVQKLIIKALITITLERLQSTWSR